MTKKYSDGEGFDMEVGSKEEALWTDIVSKLESSIKALEKELIVNKKFLEVAKSEVKKHEIK